MYRFEKIPTTFYNHMQQLFSACLSAHLLEISLHLSHFKKQYSTFVSELIEPQLFIKAHWMLILTMICALI